MREVLEPLGRQTGVELVAFVTEDGVPIAIPGSGNEEVTSVEDTAALAALSIGWMDELARSVGAVSWDRPRRVVLRAARGSLVLMRAAGGVLCVLQSPGLSPDQLRLPMEGAAARIERIVRGLGSSGPDSDGPPPCLPSKRERAAMSSNSRAPEPVREESTGN